MIKMQEQGIQIVLVEDNPADAMLVRLALVESDIPHALTVVARGDDAVQLFSGTTGTLPDLILLDLSLPGRDGFEVLATIRSNPQLESTPVVALSGSQREFDMARAYDLKANAYAVKPTDLQAALKTIKAIVRFWCLRQCEAAAS